VITTCRGSVVVAAMAFVVMFASPARADLITFDPGDYALGTNVSHLLPGLTITSLTANGQTYATHLQQDVTVGSSFDGASVIGGSNTLTDYETCYNRFVSGSTLPCSSSWRVIELLFDAPTDFVEIGSIWLEDSPSVIAYNAAGQIVSRCDSAFGPSGPCTTDFARLATPNEPFVMTSTVTSANSDIARVVFGGTFGVSSATHLAYNVPEPATLLLVALGAGGLVVRRRRAPR
jgi:hypothetical protein